jgi:hypothetical protein
MKTFHEWIEDTHPECLEEGMMGDYMKKFAIPVTAAMGVAGAFNGNTARADNKPATVQGVGHAQGTSARGNQDWMNNQEFVRYAAQQVERQMGGSQDRRIPKPEGWDELSDETQYKIYNYAHDALVRQYGVKDKNELQRMFDRETAQGRYDGSNPYKFNP